MPNPLNLSLSTEVEKENIPHVPAEIVSLDELEEMTLEDVNRAKKQLSARKQRLQLQIDDKKIKQSQEIIDKMEMILDAMTQKLLDDDIDAFAVEKLTTAYKNMLGSLNTISRLDSIDGTGRATKLVLEVRDLRGV